MVSINAVVRCAVCKRRLTDAASVSMGLGPVCYEKLHGVPPRQMAPAAATSGQVTFLDLIDAPDNMSDGVQPTTTRHL